MRSRRLQERKGSDARLDKPSMQRARRRESLSNLGSHVGAKFALLRFSLSRKTSVCFLAPPFSQKVTASCSARLQASFASALAVALLPTNLLRVSAYGAWTSKPFGSSSSQRTPLLSKTHPLDGLFSCASSLLLLFISHINRN